MIFAISPSNPKVIYAASFRGMYKSVKRWFERFTFVDPGPKVTHVAEAFSKVQRSTFLLTSEIFELTAAKDMVDREAG
jgi:hypothetical protein